MIKHSPTGELSGEFVRGQIALDSPHVTLVVNPGAGRGRAGRVLPMVCAELLTALPEVHLRVYQTTSYEEARARTLASVAQARTPRPGRRADTLIVMGGDGMAHLGLNACAESDVALGIVPAGTGNDFCRALGIPQNTLAATRAIIAGHTRRIDLTAVTGNILGTQPRYVGSVVSTGYDARVNRRTNALTLPLGPLAYGYVALSELATFEPLSYRLVIDGERRTIPAMLVAVGNAGYFGGGMNICPRYDLTDGELDITIIHPVSRATLLRLLPSLYTGGFVKDPAVELLRAKRVSLEGPGLFSMADGEDLGDVPVHLECKPRALSVYVPVRGGLA
ncbi:MAG: diacylglycerol kinase family lipid kinase [Propionibacteriaceae bacterium]|nr:diacylglycerol kinase family lipid kinase [Propionibacteriaceae bacterium]